MPRLDYMPRCAYRHRHRDRAGGIIGAGCAAGLLLGVWPLCRWLSAATHDGISPISSGVVLLVAFAILCALSLRAILENDIWETRIEEGKLYLCTPKGTQVIDVSSIAQFTIGEGSWTESGLCTARLLLIDGKWIHLDSRLVRYPSLRRALEKEHPQIRFFDRS
jgi:hypothetical protein